MSAAAVPPRWSLARAAEHLIAPDAASDKYRRGVLCVRTGSSTYPGAAVLGVEAAWRTGVGLVRYTPPLDDAEPALGLPTPAAAVLAARPETVFTAGSGRGRCDAWLLGSGTDPAQRSFTERESMRSLFGGETPLVVDAGALPELSEFAEPAAARVLAPAVLTPHRGEFLTLWRAAGLGDRPEGWPEERGRVPDEEALTDAAGALAERLGATVLLKGSLTIAATPGGFRAAAGPATPWLAAAGTGDVLAGVLGALVATHGAAVRAEPELLGPLAASAATLHDAAARLAACDPGGEGRGRPIAALDVAHALPAVIAGISD